MRSISKKHVAIMLILVALSLMSGCTNWRAKYENLNVDNENLKGRYQLSQGQQQRLSERISQDQMTIEELRRQIEDMNKTPADASGFGPGFDVSVDSAAGTVTVTLPNTILFASGKAQLLSTTIKELGQIASVLKSQYSNRRVDVVGHTDTDPIRKSGWADNWELSSERALSVLRDLEKKGVSSKLLRACGCGSARPVASNASAAGKAKNRRVEIVVYMR
ncbi:MAG: OmpA family protein [Phycisphaerae bacterium]|nr:OmpA family protein [Phycisphaerae bacterium]